MTSTEYQTEEYETYLYTLKKAQLLDLAVAKGLAKSGPKAALIARLLGRSVEPKQRDLRPIEIDQHIVDFGLEDLERDRLEQKRVRLLGKTNDELQDICRSRGQKVGGNKMALVNRLLCLDDQKKKKKIEHSAAARLLKEDIYEGRDLMDSSKEPLEADAMYHTRIQFRRYSLDEFAKLLEDLRQVHQTTKKKAEEDDKLVAHQLNYIGGMKRIDKRGIISWQFHPARKLLQDDIQNNRHLNKKPNDLRLEREEYWDLPKKYFRQKIRQEILRIKQNNYNEFQKQLNDDDSWADDISEWSEAESLQQE